MREVLVHFTRLAASLVLVCAVAQPVRAADNEAAWDAIRPEIFGARPISDGASLLELVAPVPLNVVCFRYVRPGLSNEELDRTNETILIRLQEDGLAVPSGVRIGGKFALRVANVNHRTRKSDFDALVQNVLRLGAV